MIRAEEVADKAGTSLALIASSGRVRIAENISGCVIFSGDSVELYKSMHSCVIVCDGDFTIGDTMSSCLVIARGNVRCAEGVANSLILTAGGVTFAKRTDMYSSKIQANESNGLGFVRFFDPARAGIELESAAGMARVTRVQEGKPFASAGLKPGDVLLAIDGTKVESVDSFRRLLRRKVAEDAEAVFQVRRAEMVLEITVPCKDAIPLNP